jgi:hypothetical protein
MDGEGESLPETGAAAIASGGCQLGGVTGMATKKVDP